MLKDQLPRSQVLNFECVIHHIPVEIVDDLVAVVPNITIFNENDDKEDKDMDYDVIDHKGDDYVHASGTMFDTEEKCYYTKISNSNDNYRYLYYLPNRVGMFKLVVRGEMGTNNREVLEDPLLKKPYCYAHEKYRCHFYTKNSDFIYLIYRYH